MAKVYGICGDNKCRRETLSKDDILSMVLDFYAVSNGASAMKWYPYMGMAYCGPQSGSRSCTFTLSNNEITSLYKVAAAYINNRKVSLTSYTKITYVSSGTYDITLAWDDPDVTLSTGDSHFVKVIFVKE